MFGTLSLLLHALDTKNMSNVVCFCCPACLLSSPLCRTPLTCPQRRIFGVQHIYSSSPSSGIPKTCPQGHVFGVWHLSKPPTPLFPHLCTFYFWYLPLVYFHIRIVSFFVFNFI